MGKLLAGLIGIAVLLLGGALLWPREPSTAQAVYEAQRWADQLAADRWWDSFWRAVLVGAVGALALLVFGGIVLLLVRGTIANIQTAQAPARRMVQVGPVVVPAAHLLTGHAAPLLPGIIEGHYAAELAKAQRGGTPQTIHYAPQAHYEYANDVRGAAPVITDVPPPQLPGVTTLGQTLLQGWRPTPDAILLGLGPGGERITVPVGDMLCHVVTAGKTGSGKSNTLRLLLTQLAAVGAEYYICDPHFAPVHPRTGEDWRALAAASTPQRALTDKAEIVRLVDGLAAEVETRLGRWHTGADPGPARFYLFEELPALADADKEFMRKMGRVLREGRKLGLYIITAAQDMLVSTIGGSAGLRSQFATVYYGGGDPYTARALLAAKVPEPPGKGVVWLRSVADVEPRQVRVPLVENADIARLLGSRAIIASPPFPAASAAASVPPVVEVIDVPPGSDHGKRQRVRELVKQGVKSSAIIAEVWGATGGRAYQQAADELTAILAELVP